MGLSIKDPETERLVDELATKLGASKTKAVRDAVRAELTKLDDREKRIERMKSIVQETSKIMRSGPSPYEIEQELYDEDGIPK